VYAPIKRLPRVVAAGGVVVEDYAHLLPALGDSGRQRATIFALQ
jgi:hypothetical protein